MREFDILLVLEVVDVTGEAIKSLLVQVNKSVQFDGDKDVTGLYNVLVSPRVGRTTHKEQYAIFYRTSIVQIKVFIWYYKTCDSNSLKNINRG